jgi:hypothetical protein
MSPEDAPGLEALLRELLGVVDRLSHGMLRILDQLSGLLRRIRRQEVQLTTRPRTRLRRKQQPYTGSDQRSDGKHRASNPE